MTHQHISSSRQNTIPEHANQLSSISLHTAFVGVLFDFGVAVFKSVYLINQGRVQVSILYSKVLYKEELGNFRSFYINIIDFTCSGNTL